MYLYLCVGMYMYLCVGNVLMISLVVTYQLSNHDKRSDVNAGLHMYNFS